MLKFQPLIPGAAMRLKLWLNNWQTNTVIPLNGSWDDTLAVFFLHKVLSSRTVFDFVTTSRDCFWPFWITLWLDTTSSKSSLDFYRALGLLYRVLVKKTSTWYKSICKSMLAIIYSAYKQLVIIYSVYTWLEKRCHLQKDKPWKMGRNEFNYA